MSHHPPKNIALHKVATLLHCYAKGSCIAERADVEVGSRQAWKLEQFLWFRAALRSRALQIQLKGDLLRLLSLSKCEIPYFSQKV